MLHVIIMTSLFCKCLDHPESQVNSFTWFLFQQSDPKLIHYYKYLDFKLDRKYGMNVSLGYYDTALGCPSENENYVHNGSSLVNIEEALKKSFMVIKQIKEKNQVKLFAMESSDSKLTVDENDVVYLKILNLLFIYARYNNN